MGTDDDDKKEPITPIYSSGTYPIFRANAEALVLQLEQIGHVRGALTRREKALEFLDTFERWSPTNKPSDDERFQIISAFLSFNSDTLAFIARHRPKK